MNDTMTLHLASGHELEIRPDPGATLAQAIFLRPEVEPRALCSGLGRCGACRVRFTASPPAPLEAEMDILGREAISDGWRLACRHPATAALGLAIEIPPGKARDRSHLAGPQISSGSPSRQSWLAVDLGTTSLCWRLVLGHDAIMSGQELNPQLGAGAEVMSRLAYAATRQGRQTLRSLVLDRLSSIMDTIHSTTGCNPAGLCVSGNPAMTHILLDEDTTSLGAAPYRLATRGNETRALAPDSHPELPPAYIPPLISPFVGADLSAGLASLLHAELLHREPPSFPFLLVDLGTNGEFLLAMDPETLWTASVPMGPALEGIGMRFGAMAGPGVATSFDLTPGGLTPVLLPPEDPGNCPGVAGLGYLSLVARLLESDILDSRGSFADPAGTGQGSPLKAGLLRHLTSERGVRRFGLPLAINGRSAFVDGWDVEEILKVKAAFGVCLASLLDAASIRLNDLSCLVLAGAMGEHARIRDLKTLGFLPPGLSVPVRAAGNTSLEGSALLLTHPGLRPALARACRSAQVIDLADMEGFDRLFLKHMEFRHVQR